MNLSKPQCQNRIKSDTTDFFLMDWIDCISRIALKKVKISRKQQGFGGGAKHDLQPLPMGNLATNQEDMRCSGLQNPIRA